MKKELIITVFILFSSFSLCQSLDKEKYNFHTLTYEPLGFKKHNIISKYITINNNTKPVTLSPAYTGVCFSYILPEFKKDKFYQLSIISKATAPSSSSFRKLFTMPDEEVVFIPKIFILSSNYEIVSYSSIKDYKYDYGTLTGMFSFSEKEIKDGKYLVIISDMDSSNKEFNYSMESKTIGGGSVFTTTRGISNSASSKFGKLTIDFYQNKSNKNRRAKYCTSLIQIKKGGDFKAESQQK